MPEIRRQLDPEPGAFHLKMRGIGQITTSRCGPPLRFRRHEPRRPVPPDRFDEVCRAECAAAQRRPRPSPPRTRKRFDAMSVQVTHGHSGLRGGGVGRTSRETDLAPSVARLFRRVAVVLAAESAGLPRSRFVLEEQHEKGSRVDGCGGSRLALFAGVASRADAEGPERARRCTPRPRARCVTRSRERQSKGSSTRSARRLTAARHQRRG